MISWLRRVLSISLKEFKEFRRSPLLVALAVASPLTMFLLFSYGFSLDVKDITFSFLDWNRSQSSRELVDRISQSRYFKLISKRSSKDEIHADLMNNRVSFCLVIPPEFSRDLARGRNANIQILVNGTMANRANVTRGYIEGLIADYNLKILYSYLNSGGGSTEFNMPVDILPVAKFNPTLESTNALVPGLIGLTLFVFPAIMASINLSREKEMGVILNYYTSPLGRFQYLLGKTIPLLLVSLFNFAILFFLSLWLFQVPFNGSLVALSIGAVLFLLNSIGVGFLVASIVRSQVAALMITMVFTFLMGFLFSGLLTPVEAMGPDARGIAQMLPIFYFVQIAHGVFLKGLDVAGIQNQLLMLTMLMSIMLGFILLRLKKSM